jgi:4-diphosphocytidyl-2-C-methyl-D-erythritol kinase
VSLKLVLPSFAKINLGLKVLNKRADDFHDICTIFQTISLCDTITFEPADQLSLQCSDKTVPTDDRNLILNAANALKAKFAIDKGSVIYLEKKIPSPGGLGGGSSNAAVALLGLNKLWSIGASIDKLHEMAALLGSDVPFFLSGGTAIGTGRGTAIEPISDIELSNILVVTPNISVSTAEAFASLEPRHLTSEESERILLNCRFRAERGVFTGFDLDNDFEKTVLAAHSEIGDVKDRLLELGAARTAMSGSGASVFGIFDNTETRQTALKALGDRPNWRSFAVAAISRSEYREALKQVF